jgi:hypothetical protein
MSDRMTDIVKGVGPTNTNPQALYEAVINNTVTAPTDDLFVLIPSIDQGRSTKGPVRWTPVPGPSGQLVYPTKGDIAAVSRTQEGFYWVNQFVPQTYPASLPVPTGSNKAGRWVSITAGNASGKGWTWTATTAFPGDAVYYQLGTPPGGPPYATNSGVKLLQSGVYRINANVLMQGATSGRYDAALIILNAAGAAAINLDERLNNYVSGGSGFTSHELFGEFPLAAGQWVFPDNITAQTYGDGSGAFAHLTIRYIGT